ncbi:hypothetical protein KAFR_0D01060 [Kazachstania africana CBS 2517]|uniref:Fcf2 pre-rRNA processing C-terminal domain-containing protein n=1 Tax=Kazachstania africana (strain ATCC 22294 / BCRC 22015 / CBS 2517 / CECT 1963 / NBRC 1671 / NRRL Y-8276) TaxID=1071382 RepID=H2ATQ2_KAZAF|nr:hypothetical protein KAFR_0D01060 [Kazachstania africana CBS 2517]CCF57752.1 hypothetical protein KAFR_0D01060 [Kazachstania africana CBS 2517]
MDSSVDSLFDALKKASSKTKPVSEASIGLEENHNSDVLKLDSETKDTEKIFEEIEVNLRKLPKLSTGFDKLAKEKNEKDEKLQLPQEEKHKSKNKSTSNGWFTLPKPDDNRRREIQRDLVLIKHRAALDPKRHYKKERWQVPGRFSIGTIIEDKTEFFSSRINKKERKQTIIESLMADDERNKYFKRKYNEIQLQKTSGKRAHYKKQKALRKKF